jgi:predicted peptidase
MGPAAPTPPAGEGHLAQPLKTGQHAYHLVRGDVEANYLLYLPEAYGQDPQEQWPLLLFLHGVAKRGDSLEELEVLKKDGPPMLVEKRADFPFVVLSPQCPSDSDWVHELDRVLMLLDEIANSYRLDPDRFYLTGLSMGGFGAWWLALAHPERFAAVVPIAGGYQWESDAIPDAIVKLKDVPLWVFHGARDSAVNARQSEVLVQALQACGSKPRFTLYPDAEHDTSWKLAYADPDLYRWLLEQRLSARRIDRR